MTGDPVSRENQPLDFSRPGIMNALNGRERPQAMKARSSRLTVNLPKDLVERLRDTAYWIPQFTLSRLVEEALSSSLAQLESANGGRFPKRTEELKPGRPRSVRAARRIVEPLHAPAPIHSLDARTLPHSSTEQRHEDRMSTDPVPEQRRSPSVRPSLRGTP